MCWLHSLLNDCYELLTQLAQVHFISQRGTESGKGDGGIILSTVKATINDSLNTMVQGLEQSGNGECRDHDGDIINLINDPLEQVLQGKDEAEVEQSKDGSQGAID